MTILALTLQQDEDMTIALRLHFVSWMKKGTFVFPNKLRQKSNLSVENPNDVMMTAHGGHH